MMLKLAAIWGMFGDPNVGPPQLRLHYVRVEMTQARREFSLRL
jgi:hypothetical protein